MLIIDANLLVYAYNPRAPQHERSRVWLEEVFASGDPVGIPVFSIAAFLRLVTDRRLHKEFAVSAQSAIKVVESWIVLPNVRVLYPTELHWQMFKELMLRHQVTGALLSDLQIAALALEHGGEVCSADNDFAEFPEVSFRNPLI